MADPTVEALYAMKSRLNEYAQASYMAPKKEPFEHGHQVGICHGLMEAIRILENALSAGDQADAQL